MVLVSDRHMSDVFFIDGGAKTGCIVVLVSDTHMSDVLFIDGVSVVPTYGSWSQIGILSLIHI